MQILLAMVLVVTGTLSGMNSNIVILNKEKQKDEPTLAIITDHEGPYIKIYGKNLSKIRETLYKDINKYTKVHIDSCEIEKLNTLPTAKTLIITNCTIKDIDRAFGNRLINLTILNNKISNNVSKFFSKIKKNDNITIHNNVVIEFNANNSVNNN